MTTEDHQPNEVFKQPKGRNIIPSIRPSKPPKWQTARMGVHRGRGAPKHAQWNRQAYTQSDRIDASSDNFSEYPPPDTTHESSHLYAQQNTGHSNNFSTPIYAPPCRAHNLHSTSTPTPSFPTISSTEGHTQETYKPPECTYAYHTPSQLAPVPSENGGSLDTVKRRSREWESEKGPVKKRKAKTKPVVREMEIELPEGCKKGAASRSHSKSLFLADVRDGMRQTVGAEILNYRYTDTHLIISYNPPDAHRTNRPFDTPSNLDTPASNASNSDLQLENIYRNTRPLYNATMTGAMSSQRGSNELSNQMDRPSGSNVKLEDLYSSSYGPNTAGAGIANPFTADMRDPPAKEAYTSIAEALSISNVDQGDLYNSIYDLVVPESGHSAPAASAGQSFSPEAVIPYAQVEVVRNIPKQISKRPRRFRSGITILSYGPPPSPVPSAPPLQEHNPTFSEIIEIEDTPPLSPRMEKSRSAENNTTVCRTPSPSITEDLLQREMKPEPEPESQMDVFLEEETSTVTHLPRASGDKSRRLLISYSQDRIYSVSMHGFVQEVVRKKRR